ncbi:MAG TPA: hypothetical protein VGF56_14875 [Rhizomicrobium sp.]|jgi:hypothetical protein
MKKVAVGPTLSASYSFVFENYLRILGVVWFPIALLFAMMFWQFVPAMANMPVPAPGADPAAMLSSLGQIFLFELVAFLLIPLLCCGITKLALGRALRWPFFYVAIDGDYWRLLLSYFLVGLIFFGIVFFTSLLVGIVVGVVAVSMSGGHPDPGQLQQNMGALRLVVAIPIYGVMIAILIRFGFLLAPIVITERKLGIGRNWNLTRGNFWRIFVVVLGVLIPAIVLSAAQYVLLAALGGPSMNLAQSFGSPEAQMALSRNMMRLYATYWYVLVAAGLLFAPLFYGLFLGAAAFIYRDLASDQVPSDVFS